MPGYSIHIGLNFVDPIHYDGWDGELNACEDDMANMAKLADQAGFTQLATLATKHATRQNVLDEISAAARKAKSGDLVMVTYSGHGGVTPNFLDPDENGDDETWCLYDAQLLDDELVLAWKAFKEGVRLLVVSDSCHSGGLQKFFPAGGGTDLSTGSSVSVRQAPASAMRGTYFANRGFYDALQKGARDASKGTKMQAQGLLLAACLEDEYAYESPFGGYFTSALTSAWDFGRFAGNYDEFNVAIDRQLPQNQNSTVKRIASSDPVFRQQNPFQI